MPVTGLSRQRLDRPYVRVGGKLKPASWAEAFAAIAAQVKQTTPDKMAAIVGDLAAAEEIKALKDLMTALGVTNLDCRQDGAKIGANSSGGNLPRQTYLFNSTIAGVEAADAILLVGANPRWDAPVLNARIRKAWLASGVKVANIGPAVDLTYPVQQLGTDIAVLEQIAKGSHDFAKILTDAKRPMIVLGSGALTRKDGAAILKLAAKIAGDTGMIGPAGSHAEGGWNGFNILHTAASRVAALDLGFLPGTAGATSPESWTAPRRARSTLYICWARTNSTSPIWAAPLWSIRAAMAMPAPIMPTWSCRAPPIPRRTACT